MKKSLIMSIIAGLILSSAYSLHPPVISAYISSVFLLISLSEKKNWEHVVYGSITGILASLSLILYLLKISAPLPTLLFTLMRGIEWGIIALFTGKIRETYKDKSLIKILAFPTVLTTVEYLISLFSVHGSGGSLIYSQMEFPTIIQLVSIGGISLGIFFLGLVSSTIAEVILDKGLKSKEIIGISLSLIMLLLGFYNLNSKSIDKGTYTITTASTDEFQFVDKDWKKVSKAYINALMLEKTGDISILPEKMFSATKEENEMVISSFKNIAKGKNTVIVYGAEIIEGDKFYNRAFFITPQGEVHRYDKIHMIPGFESKHTPGNDSLIIKQGNINIGTAICKDMDFPRTINIVILTLW